MKLERPKLSVLLVGIALLIAPHFVLAQQFFPLITPITGGAAQCNTTLDNLGCFTDPCTTCHLLALSHNVLETLIALAVLLAVLLFIYAGWIYLTTSVRDQIQKAHRIFWQVFIGLIVVLTAWLIVDTGLRVLARNAGNTQTGVLPFTDILCDPSALVNACRAQGSRASTVGAGPPGGPPGTIPDPNQSGGSLPLSHNSALLGLGATPCSATVSQTLCVTSTSGPGGVQQTCQTGTGCTSLNGLRQGTVELVNNIVGDCIATVGNCSAVIVGGTEPGHAAGEYSHGSGYKVDIDDNDTGVNNYFETITDGLTPQTTNVGPRYSIIQPDGSTMNIIRESDHWDVQYCPPGFVCPPS